MTNLEQQALQIRDEQAEGANTAIRVGGLLLNIVNQLAAVSSNIVRKDAVDTYAALLTTYPTPLNGWSVLVRTEKTIFVYNGTKWVNTETAVLPEDVARKSELQAVENRVAKVEQQFSPSPNLVNPAELVLGHFLDNAGNPTGVSADYNTTGYILVKEGDKVYQSTSTVSSTLLEPQFRFISFYNASKAAISVLQRQTNGILVPTGAAYVRITYPSTYANYQVELNAITPYSPFGIIALHARLADTATYATTAGKVLGSSYAGKKWVCIGDSITAQGLYVYPVTHNTAMVLSKNIAEGGRQLGGDTGMNTDAVLNLIPTDADVITLLGGTNDWAQSVPLGTLTDTTNKTYLGALKICIEKISTRFPLARLVLMTPPYGELYARTVAMGWANSYTNALGLTTADYGKAVQEAGKRYGIPVADIGGEAGWNMYNIRTFVKDDGGLLHPLQIGANRIAEVLVGTLNRIPLGG